MRNYKRKVKKTMFLTLSPLISTIFFIFVVFIVVDFFISKEGKNILLHEMDY